MLGLTHDATLLADEQLWTLRKNARTAVLWQALHPLGLELRLHVDGDTVRTRIEKSVHQVRDATVHMRAAILTKGWV